MNINPSAHLANLGHEALAKATLTVTSVAGPAGPEAVELARRKLENLLREAQDQFNAYFDDLLRQTSHASAQPVPPHPVQHTEDTRKTFLGIPFGEPQP